MEYKEKYLKYKEKYLELRGKLSGGSNEQFQLDIKNKDINIGIYALAAPDDCASTNMKILHFERIQKIVKDCIPKGLIVYDVQDEKCRDGKERPFRFNKKEKSDIFASFLAKKFPSQNIITYRVLPNENIKEDEFIKWIDATIDQRKLKNIVYVGGSKGLVGDSTMIPYNYTLKYIKKYQDIIVGGITLPERYKKEGWDEAEILFKKTLEGCTFFVSQIVYNFDYITRLLNEYAEKCVSSRIDPARIIFTFALFGEKKTVDFMNCLGIDIPDTIKSTLETLSDESYITYSMDLCISNWQKIIELRNNIESEKKIKIPIGFSADVISGNKMEFEQSIELYKRLDEISKKI